MKKIFLSIVLLLVINIVGQAQVNPHAIGLRFGGGNFGNGAEISYQHGFGDVNRLELDLGWGGNSDYSRIGIAGIYHWVWNIDGGFNWYAGPGAQVWTFSYNDSFNNNGGVRLGVGGQIGIEYDFNEKNAPILLSLDTRPMFNFISNGSGFGYGVHLSVRYTF